MNKLGVVTIGQAPRRDIGPILEEHIGSRADILQVGALDGMTKEDIDRCFCPGPGDYVLTSRLLSGDPVVLSREKITPIVQEKIRGLEEEGCEQILLLCTGVFPGLKTQNAYLIEPDQVIPPVVAALVGNRKFGLVVPLRKQHEHMKGKWGKVGLSPVCTDVSPYSFDEIKLNEAVQTLKSEQVEIVLMDCMGYVEEMRMRLKEQTGLPVILSNAIMAKMISETL